MELKAQKDFSDVMHRSKIYMQSSRYDAAEKLVRQTMEEHGNLAHLQNMLGVTLAAQSKFLEAISAFSEAFSANTLYLEAGLNLMVLLCDLGRYEDADRVFELLQTIKNPIKNQPTLVLGRIANLHVKNGKAYMQANLFHEASGEFRKALGLYEDMPDVKLLLAQCYLKISEWDKALRLLQELETTNEFEVKMWLGILHYKMGHLDLARRAWAYIQDGSPEQRVLARLAEEWKT